MDSDLLHNDPDMQNDPAQDIVPDDLDDTAVFLDAADAVEVKVHDDDVPMDDDDEIPADVTQPSSATTQEAVVIDMSKAKMESHTGEVYAVAAHYDATSKSLSVISGGGDDKAFLHRIVPGQAVPSTMPLAHSHTDSVSCVAFNMRYISEDLTKTPKLAAVGAYDGAIVLYDPDTGALVKEFEGPSDVEWVCFHPKGGTVILAGSIADGTIWMYHIPTSKCLQVFVGHESGVTAGSFTPDGRWALSASSDGTLRIWAPRTGLNKHVFRLGQDGAGLTCMGVGGGSDGQLVIVGAEDGMAHVCHFGTKKVVASLRHFEPPVAAATTGQPHSDDAMEDGQEELEVPMSVEAVGFASPSVNPNWCATGGVDGVLKIWDLANNGQCRQICRRVAEDGDAASTTTSSSNVGGITRLNWHPTLPLVFTSSSDGTIRLWDARNGTLLQTLTGHADMINDMDVDFLNVENNGGTAIICSGSDDKTVRIYELDMAAAVSQTTGGP